MTPLETTSTLVRAWTRLYTWRLPTSARDVRRAEIDSDLWEFGREHGRGVLPALHVISRLLLGIPDDLRWRASHMAMGPARLRAVISLAVMALFAAGVWVYSATRQPTELPTPAPLVRFIDMYAPPPPPPPPPPPRPRRSR
jgi:hypothetical protein